MKKRTILLVTVVFAFLFNHAQNISQSPAYIKALTAQWKGERFADGRPKVSDALLERLKNITLEEAWAELIELGYPNQYEGEWMHLHEGDSLVMTGRAVTAQFIPTRPDLDSQVRAQGKIEGHDYKRATTSWAIKTLVEGDIYVGDTYLKPHLGTLIGSNLGNGVYSRTHRGVICYGNVRDMEDLRKIDGFNAWIKGSDPSYMRQTMLITINAPVRIGHATVLPGDAVLAKTDGVLFIPAHLVEHIVLTGEVTELFDIFGQQRIKEKKYTAGEIDSKWTPEIKADFREWVKNYEGTMPMSKEELERFLESRNF
jgi:regulator of RNase E activity RraA